MEQPNDTTYEDLDEGVVGQKTREDKIRMLNDKGLNMDLSAYTEDELDNLLEFYTDNPTATDPSIKKIRVESDDVDNQYIVGNKLIISEDPPPDLNTDQLRDWWVNQLNKEDLSMSKIPTQSDYERFCLRCTTINPCTGDDICAYCKSDISPETGQRNFIRTKKSNQHSPHGQR